MTKKDFIDFWIDPDNSIEEVWDFIETALDQAYSDGKDDGAEYFCLNCYESIYGDPDD